MPWRWSIGPVFPANEKKIAQKPLKPHGPLAGLAGAATPVAKLVAYKVLAKAPVQKPRLITVPSRVITDPSPGATLPASLLGETKPGDSEARLALARDLQWELKRVGCYVGNIDGVWGRGSKDAMGAFTRRVNADLPFDEPDYILLTLVQGHFTKACGRSCGSGEVLSDDGRCLAGSVRAQTIAARPDNLAADTPSGRTQAPEPAKAAETDNATEAINASARLISPPKRARRARARLVIAAPRPVERRVQAMSDILASRVTQNSARLDGGAKAGKRPADAPDFTPLAVTAATQIRTPSIAPTNNDAAKRALAALNRAADRAAAKTRAEEFVQEQRRQAARVRAKEENRQVAAIARAEEQRQAVADNRASRRRAARAQARKERARRKRRRRIARASSGGRKSYLGAKQRRRARSRPRRTRRRRSNWKQKFWASQGM